ncbi:hypothetical protein, partial [Sphaerotilus natans]|uniref:hypothetical protein n=1 Tax=Sphaerotilus natans TaxID=34103 RepID=UPI0019D3A5AD
MPVSEFGEIARSRGPAPLLRGLARMGCTYAARSPDPVVAYSFRETRCRFRLRLRSRSCPPILPAMSPDSVLHHEPEAGSPVLRLARQ